MATSMDMQIPRALHPAPDRVREQWMNLNGTWEFSFGEPVFDREITVPFSWVSPLSGIGEDVKGTGWYRRKVTYNPGNNRLFLQIGAVDYESDVFVNAVHLTHHFGGYTPVSVDVTSVWNAEGENEIIIRAVDYDYEYQTYGKQGYGNLRGIWQTVWLEERPQTYIEDFRIVTELSGKVSIYVDAQGVKERRLAAEFVCGDGESVLAEAEGEELVLQIDDPKLWSPEEPCLYEGTLSLISAEGVDRIHTYFGIREVGAAHVDGKKRSYITLNGKPLYINGCLDQSFNAAGFFTLPKDEDTKNEILQMKALGLNCARIHIKPEDPRKLYWADKLGLLIMEDIPCYWGAPEGVAKAFYEPQMMEVLKRDKNHPSIFYWVVFNESWGLLDEVQKEDGTKEKVYTEETQKWVVDCYRKVKAYDPTRLVEDNSPCRLDHTVTDVNTWHFYANGYDNTKKNIVDYVENSNVGDTFNFIGEYACGDVPLMNSECGNVWGLDGSAGDSDISWHYKYMMNEFRLHEEVCGFIFTEFRDVINEFNGYYRLDDARKEFGYEAYVPGMSLNDLHSYDFLAVDAEPMKTCKPGEKVALPLKLSSFTDVNHGANMQVAWELVLDTGLEEVLVEKGSFPIQYTTYGVTDLGTLELTMPEENGIAKVRLYLQDMQGQIVMRNFMVFDVQGEKEVLTVPMTAFVCDGAKRAWCLQQDQKLNLVGEGTAQITVSKNQIPGYEAGKKICITFEASAKQELTKDKLDNDFKKDADLGYMRGYRVDRGANPNSYFQTDEDRFEETILCTVGKGEGLEIFLPNAPCDSRGCLSWHYQANPRKNEEAGSYGYVCRVEIGAEEAQALEETFRIAITGTKGFSLYGRNSGRYPLGFEISACEN